MWCEDRETTLSGVSQILLCVRNVASILAEGIISLAASKDKCVLNGDNEPVGGTLGVVYFVKSQYSHAMSKGRRKWYGTEKSQVRQGAPPAAACASIVCVSSSRLSTIKDGNETLLVSAT